VNQTGIEGKVCYKFLENDHPDYILMSFKMQNLKLTHNFLGLIYLV